MDDMEQTRDVIVDNANKRLKRNGSSLSSPSPTNHHEENINLDQKHVQVQVHDQHQDGHDHDEHMSRYSSTCVYCDHVSNYLPGFRFQPSDKELIDFYLKRKIADQKLPAQMVIDVELYKFNPEDLAAKYSPQEKNQWYFFTPRERKYRNGGRPNRAADGGYWKATGRDKEVGQIGHKKVLVFYRGKAPHGSKTDWIMHEYILNQPSNKRKRNGIDDMRLDDWVLCKIYKKSDRNPLRNPLMNERRKENNDHEQEHEGPLTTNQTLVPYSDNLQNHCNTNHTPNPNIPMLLGFSTGDLTPSSDDQNLYDHCYIMNSNSLPTVHNYQNSYNHYSNHLPTFHNYPNYLSNHWGDQNSYNHYSNPLPTFHNYPNYLSNHPNDYLPNHNVGLVDNINAFDKLQEGEASLMPSCYSTEEEYSSISGLIGHDQHDAFGAPSFSLPQPPGNMDLPPPPI